MLLLTGCFKSKDVKLCDAIDEVNSNFDTSDDDSKEYTAALQEKYDEYCEKEESEVCTTLKRLIAERKVEAKTQIEIAKKELVVTYENVKLNHACMIAEQ